MRTPSRHFYPHTQVVSSVLNRCAADVKPDNILESAPGSGSYRLADFGLCMPLDVAHQGPRLPEGDSRYLCGELLNEESICHFDKADVFALGASLLELSLGRELTRSGSEYQALRQVIYSTVYH